MEYARGVSEVLKVSVADRLNELLRIMFKKNVRFLCFIQHKQVEDLTVD